MADGTFTGETVWEFTTAGTIRFGEGAAEELPAVLRERDADSALFVTDPGVVDAGILEPLADSLADEADISVFDGVEPDPPIDAFEEAVRTARAVDPDAIIGVGGGSSLDVAKVTGIVAEHGGDILDYVAPPTGGGKPVPGPGIPTIAVPTTSGTGSETTPVAVVSLPDRDLKVGISSRHQYPDVALVDPLLTVSLPPGPTAASGMDALAHGIESYVTRRFDAKPRADPPEERPDYGGRTVVTDQLGRRAIELVGNHLRRAVNNGQDIEARRAVSLGSLMAGMAFSNAGVGAAHAIGMAAGAEYHTPHGATVAAVLPAVMRFNATGAFERSADVARMLGEDVSGLGQEAAARKGAEAVEKLRRDVGTPDGLEALGVPEDEIPALAEKTMDLQRLLVSNPRRASQADIEAICRDAL